MTKLMRQRREFAVELVRIKDKAGRLGLYVTMQALDKATNAVGYEIEYILMKNLKIQRKLTREGKSRR